MVKRTRDLVYRPYNIANSMSPEFLPPKKNRDDVYFIEQVKVLKAPSTPEKKAATPAPELSASEAPVTQPVVKP
ncbi:hypothetical protein N8I77_002849 [Diaporthe amygdali]|uniref:Uncharacterized protein n=1 Tax=Phomopsis amygdali TaxID=1214568 RepID=A0AAD9W9K8_PHOAM|nr:hypothetical protein N8I77_002849 [Diaporthe amygdali]